MKQEIEHLIKTRIETLEFVEEKLEHIEKNSRNIYISNNE